MLDYQYIKERLSEKADYMRKVLKTRVVKSILVAVRSICFGVKAEMTFIFPWC